MYFIENVPINTRQFLHLSSRTILPLHLFPKTFYFTIFVLSEIQQKCCFLDIFKVYDTERKIHFNKVLNIFYMPTKGRTKF